MRPDSFVFETLAHFVRNVDGPPPGVPLGADAEFETTLATMCVEQAISPVVSASLDRLSLPPNLSALTAARLRRHAAGLRAAAGRRRQLAVRVGRAFAAARIRYALMGGVRSAVNYPSGQRAIGVVEILIEPRESARAIRTLTSIGLRLNGPHAVFGRSIPNRTVSNRRAGELLRYHHFFSPLLLSDERGLVVRLRHRGVDTGDIHAHDDALDRAILCPVGQSQVSGVSDEDHMVDLAVRAGVDALAVLPTVVDIARLVAVRGDALNWNLVAARARLARLYAPVCYVVRHACSLMGINDQRLGLEPIGRIPESFLRAWWAPDRIDYADLPARRAGRFVFGVMFAGRMRTRIRWVWGHVAFHRRWVRNRLGGRPTLWRSIRFLFVSRETPEWWRALATGAAQTPLAAGPFARDRQPGGEG